MVDVSARARRRAARARVGVIVGATRDRPRTPTGTAQRRCRTPPTSRRRRSGPRSSRWCRGRRAWSPTRVAAGSPRTRRPTRPPASCRSSSPSTITETTCRIPVISSRGHDGPDPADRGRAVHPAHAVRGRAGRPASSSRPAASLSPDPGFWTATAPAVARPSTRAAGRRTCPASWRRARRTGTWPDAAPPAVTAPGRARPSWTEPGRPGGRSRTRTTSVAADGTRRCPPRTVARGPAASPPRRRADHRADPARPAVDDHLTGPVADEPITAARRRARAAARTAAPSAHAAAAAAGPLTVAPPRSPSSRLVGGGGVGGWPWTRRSP